MLINSIPTVLIPAWEQARRSLKRRGSVACTEQGERSGITCSQPFVRVSRIWLECILKDETERGRRRPLCHTVIKVAYRLVRVSAIVLPDNQLSRRASSEEVKLVESQPKYGIRSHNVNMGSSKLVQTNWMRQYDDGVPVVPNGWPVMGSAIGNQSNRTLENKTAVMPAKPQSSVGEGEQFLYPVNNPERRIASAV